jgi:hypothetical protein
MSSEEFQRFDATVRKVLSVSHNELLKREKQWKKDRARAKKKRARTSPASRASNDKG